jgi:hypothetical protein
MANLATRSDGIPPTVERQATLIPFAEFGTSPTRSRSGCKFAELGLSTFT